MGLTLGSVVGVVAAYRGDLKFEHQQRRKNGPNAKRYFKNDLPLSSNGVNYAVVGVRIETIFYHQALHQQPK
jgi:hypothetical protein